MENASKALLMAAGMLISLLIISLAVYLFSTFGAQAANVRAENAQQQLRRFNEQFTIYEEQSGKNTIYDVVTAANVAKNSNEYYEFSNRSKNDPNIGKDNYILVLLNGNSIQNNNDLLKNNTNKLYKCSVTISDITGRVCKVEFSG